jgi:hypothetical protein
MNGDYINIYKTSQKAPIKILEIKTYPNQIKIQLKVTLADWTK